MVSLIVWVFFNLVLDNHRVLELGWNKSLHTLYIPRSSGLKNTIRSSIWLHCYSTCVSSPVQYCLVRWHHTLDVCCCGYKEVDVDGGGITRTLCTACRTGSLINVLFNRPPHNQNVWNNYEPTETICAPHFRRNVICWHSKGVCCLRASVHVCVCV
jgi:hypothetical protein